LAQKLARFHSIKAPLPKQNLTLFNFRDSYRKAFVKHPDLKQQLVDLKLELLQKTDIIAELDWLERVTKAMDCPVGFIHHDYKNMNLLVKNESDSPGNNIVVCDFEYACYGYRGIDFGILFSNWGMQGFQKHHLPSKEVLSGFLNEYIKESVKIHGEKFARNASNSVERMIKEVHVFHLAMCVFRIAIFLGIEEDSQMENFNRANMMVSLLVLCRENEIFTIEINHFFHTN
jgi:thiamine kinase-like enzyme